MLWPSEFFQFSSGSVVLWPTPSSATNRQMVLSPLYSPQHLLTDVALGQGCLWLLLDWVGMLLP